MSLRVPRRAIVRCAELLHPNTIAADYIPLLSLADMLSRVYSLLSFEVNRSLFLVYKKDNMLPVRERPKEQSSDEDDTFDVDIQPAGVGDLIDLDRQLTFVNVVASMNDGGASNNPSVSSPILKSKESRCGNDKSKPLIAQCDALHRLALAMKAYSTMVVRQEERQTSNSGDEAIDDLGVSESDHDSFPSEFIGSDSRVQFLDDFNHFIAKHRESANEIKEEMIEHFDFAECEALKCQLAMRHFGRDPVDNDTKTSHHDARSVFYRQKFDALHFHIFHLMETGYRHRQKNELTSNPNSQKTAKADGVIENKIEDEDDDNEAIDEELQSTVTTINDQKKKFDFPRFQGDGPNKFTLNVSGINYLVFIITI